MNVTPSQKVIGQINIVFTDPEKKATDLKLEDFEDLVNHVRLGAKAFKESGNTETFYCYFEV
jgi:hypothetical protein